MRRSSTIRRAARLSALALGVLISPAQATYWSLFNVEGESALTAQYVTYDSLNEMLTDTNRLGVFNPSGGSAGRNIVGSGSDGGLYWSLFNVEGESALTAQYVTYASLNEMLTDTNRLGVFNPSGGSAGRNIVGSGSDGGLYWSLFNVEGESALTAQYVTYASLNEMLTDTNRLGVFNPGGGSAGRNIVGSGSGGGLYWSLFNVEGESALTAQYVTYASLNEMLMDTNRLGVFNPSGGSAGRNIVGSGSDVIGGRNVPEPTTLALGALAGLLLMVSNSLARRRGSATVTSGPTRSR